MKAKQENYPARSVYKLKEIQQKFRIIKKNDIVLDLGCAPGAWLKYTAEQVGSKGKVVGIDILPVQSIAYPNITTIQGDVLLPDTLTIYDNLFHVILSDMAPATTGRKEVDAFKSLELCLAAFKISKLLLKSGGHFICKIFQGKETSNLFNTLKATFQQVKQFKPMSCRKASKEIYFIGLCKQQE